MSQDDVGDLLSRVEEVLMPKNVFSKDTVDAVQKILSVIELSGRFVTLGIRQPLYIYDKKTGIWVDEGEGIIRAIAAEMLADDQKYKSHIVSECVQSLKDRSLNRDVVFNSVANTIVVENGRVNIETGEFFESFDPDEYHTIRLPVRYDPDARCPNIEQFMSEVLQPQDIPAMYEFFGYCLFKDWIYDLLVMLLGEGANGKTIMFDVLGSFLGEKNTTAIGLHTLERDKFARGYLRGKLANIAGEIPDWALKSVDKIKDLTGGGMIDSDVKYFDRVRFKNTCKQIFSSNNPPPIDDDSHAMWRRMRVFKFLNTFDSDNPKTIPRDILLARLTTPTEHSGLLNLAITGWQRLRKQGCLTATPNVETTRVDYMRTSNPLRFLVERFFNYDIDAPNIDKVGLYEVYRRWCAHEGRKPIATNRFYKDVLQYCTYLGDSQMTIGDRKRVRVYTTMRVDLGALTAEGVNIAGVTLYIDGGVVQESLPP